MSIYDNFVPTYLYIKQHSITGMLYFGKTSCNNPETYMGSGTYWLKHINKHGRKHVVTLWYELFTDRDDLIKFATKFSSDLCIVKSTSWANLIEENGLDGAPIGHIHSDESRQMMVANHKGMRGKRHTDDAKRMIREKQQIRWYHTPHGKFTSIYSAAKVIGVCSETIRFRCMNADAVIQNGRMVVDKSIVGKTWREVGYWFENFSND